MPRQRAMLTMLTLMLGASSVLAENAISAPKPTDFAFHRNQSVYIVAFHYEASHSKSGFDRTGVGDYLAAERLVRMEFEKFGIFKPVDKPSEADYVFVVYVHDRAAEGLAVAPEKYGQTKTDLFKGDLDPLRDAAYARCVVGPFKLPTLGRISAQLVKKFHDEAKQ